MARTRRLRGGSLIGAPIDAVGAPIANYTVLESGDAVYTLPTKGAGSMAGGGCGCLPQGGGYRKRRSCTSKGGYRKRRSCTSKGGYRKRRSCTSKGGYRATAKNRAMLSKYRAGKSIGFTGIASLKAKGLLPRTSRKNQGKKIVGPKYRR